MAEAETGPEDGDPAADQGPDETSVEIRRRMLATRVVAATAYAAVDENNGDEPVVVITLSDARDASWSFTLDDVPASTLMRMIGDATLDVVRMKAEQ